MSDRIANVPTIKINKLTYFFSFLFFQTMPVCRVSISIFSTPNNSYETRIASIRVSIFQGPQQEYKSIVTIFTKTFKLTYFTKNIVQHLHFHVKRPKRCTSSSLGVSLSTSEHNDGSPPAVTQKTQN